MKWMKIEEIDIILERFKDNATFICSFLTSCYTGLRTGEVFALTWEDIDLDKEIINIKYVFMIDQKTIKEDGI